MTAHAIAPALLSHARLRVAIVSTYPPAECGIGTYTRELVAALGARVPATDVIVLAEQVPGVASTATVRRVWQRRGDWLADLLAAVDREGPDVVHIQHEETHLGMGRSMLDFVRALRVRRIAVVVTLHTVYSGFLGRRFHRSLTAEGAHLIVHQRTGMADVLAAQGVVGEQVAMIAHGTPALELPDQASARAALDLPPTGAIALFFGFIHPGKGLHVAVSAFDRAVRDVDAHLVIVGRIRRRWPTDALYAALLRRRMRHGVAAGRIHFRPGFVAAEAKASYFAAADLLVLPHQQRYGSASGVLHEALAARRAFICTRGNKFAEAVEAMDTAVPDAFPRRGDVTAWAHGLTTMLGSSLVRTRMSVLASELAEATSWSSSAEDHATLYDRVALRDGSRSSAVLVR